MFGRSVNGIQSGLLHQEPAEITQRPVTRQETPSVQPVPDPAAFFPQRSILFRRFPESLPERLVPAFRADTDLPQFLLGHVKRRILQHREQRKIQPGIVQQFQQVPECVNFRPLEIIVLPVENKRDFVFMQDFRMKPAPAINK